MTVAPVSPSSARSLVDSKGKPWSTTLAVIGDFGNVSQMKNNLYDEKMPVNYVGEAIRQINPDIIISLGDDNYVEGKREWKDFNVGKNYAPYIYPYTVSMVNSGNPEALAFADPGYLAQQVVRKPWNRFFTAPGNHEVGMSGGVGFMEASGRRDWSHDYYYKASLEGAKVKGSVIPLASSYVKPGDDIYFDYSYGTPGMPATWFKKWEGAMDPSYYDYLVKPIDKNGVVLSDLANIYMVDRNNAAYGEKNTGYAKWKKKNPSKELDPQAEFLMAEAKRRDSEVSWQIYANHYETYSTENMISDPSSKGIRKATHLPYFASGIDLVLGAHVHNYERSRNPDSTGMIGDYIVNGNGGYNTAYLAGTAGLDEVFSLVGQVPGYQAGTTGGWGFGLIDMNKDELQYRQFNVQFDYVKNPKPSLIAGDYLYGQNPIDQVKVIEVDRLVLRKPESVVSASVDSDKPLMVLTSAPEVTPKAVASGRALRASRKLQSNAMGDGSNTLAVVGSSAGNSAFVNQAQKYYPETVESNFDPLTGQGVGAVTSPFLAVWSSPGSRSPAQPAPKSVGERAAGENPFEFLLPEDFSHLVGGSTSLTSAFINADRTSAGNDGVLPGFGDGNSHTWWNL